MPDLGTPRPEPAGVYPPVLVVGIRNNGLTSYAGRLRARGFERDEILWALREANKERCIPPVPDSELRNIAKSAAKWAPHPTGDDGSVQHRVAIPRGCFDPRISVCGFDAAAVVETDTTLGLRRRHRTLYRVLVGFFGPYGCHPSQDSIGDAIAIHQQQVSREVKHLVRAGLILTEAGAYRVAARKYASTTYHFCRHHLFVAYLTRRGLPVFSDLQNFTQHFVGLGSLGFRYSKSRPDNRETQQDSGILTTQSVVVEPISTVLAGWGKNFSATHLPDPPGCYITRFAECVVGCGGCRIEYADGTLKQYECSCAVEGD